MQILWLILFYAYMIFGYEFIISLPSSNFLILPLDNSIPLITLFVVPYLFATLMFLAMPFILYFSAGWEKTKPYLIVQTIAITISYVIYLVYPTTTIRPEIIGTDVFSQLVLMVYSSDQPAGLFPSGHVFMSIIIAYFLWKYYPKTRVWVGFILPLVILSTVFIKQHHTPDILGGIAVALIAIYTYTLFQRFTEPKKQAQAH